MRRAPATAASGRPRQRGSRELGRVVCRAQQGVWADLRAERVERLEQHGEDAKLPSSTRCEEPAKQTGYLRVEIKGDVCGGQAVRIAGTQEDRHRDACLWNVALAYFLLRVVERKSVPSSAS